MSDTGGQELRKLPLADIHKSAGARFGPFAGFEMPVRYGSIIDEHHAVRNRAGIFDVSHMGEVFVRGPSGQSALQYVFTNDISGLCVGRAKYGAFCRSDGGMIDDVIVYRLADEEWLICANASRREEDVSWLKKHCGEDAAVRDESGAWCQFAVQGPRAIGIVDSCADASTDSLGRFAVVSAEIDGANVLMARTGYTGEDGVELFVRNEDAAGVYRTLMGHGSSEGIVPVGLGARDTLRLEAGLLLYGTDMDETVSPLEAGIVFAVSLDSGDFIGRDALLEQQSEGLKRKIIGIKLLERGALRGGETVCCNGEEVGVVTSASIAPSLDKAMIGHAMVELSASGQSELEIVGRRRSMRAAVVERPFYRA